MAKNDVSLGQAIVRVIGSVNTCKVFVASNSVCPIAAFRLRSRRSLIYRKSFQSIKEHVVWGKGPMIMRAAIPSVAREYQSSYS